MFTMKKDMEALSTSSSASKASSEKRKNSPRFSLQRFFYSRGAKSKSRTSIDSDSRSESSLTSPPVNPPDRSNRRPSKSTSFASLPPNFRKGNTYECPLCLSEQLVENFPDIQTCHHRSCHDCLKHYLKIEITESRINIACPECSERFHPNDITMILQDNELIVKYEAFMVRRVLVSDPDTRWCPAPDCGYAVIATGCAGCPKLICERPGCGTFFCYHCKQKWHPNQTCDAARAERSIYTQSASISYNADSTSQSQNEIKPCPRCGAFIIKMNDGSCNHMTCAVCGAEFCWLCMKEISDLHYLSPSGCTFWGKKPWSRKKKILWQLGTLVGAPVGITLMAGIAVPAMIIGIPVWVGRKLHTRYEFLPKHRRNLAITGGVSASILISPIVAGLAVGIGVPILLAYIYGVVPISLCRSGGCGVTTTNRGGVRFEFDEDTAAGGQTGQNAGDNQSIETVHHVANPSIGPSIGEASVGMLSASGGHIDRVGILRDESDRDSSSNRAIAGSSITGSLCDSTYTASSTYHSKLEVQADVTTNPTLNKRSSLSSESANFSVSEKSATVSFSDDASTKANAGYRERDAASVTTPPLEVTIDVLAATATCHHHNSSSSLSQDKTQKGLACQNSPTSTRSISFAPEEDVKPAKCRRCKQFSLSVGDRINETVEARQLDILSTQSLHGEGGKEPIAPRSLIETATDTYRNKAGKNTTLSCDSVGTGDSQLEGLRTNGLTEVESDRPTFVITPTSVSSSGHSASDASEEVSKNCANKKDMESRNQRRRSCEIAMQQGLPEGMLFA